MSVTVVINNFTEAMLSDARGNGARILKHLDNYSEDSAFSVLPDNDATSADRGANAFDSIRIQQFVYANYLSNPTFFGLGVQSGTQLPEIYSKTSVADGTAWAASNHTGDFAALTALGSVGQAGPVAFCLYQSFLYGVDGLGWWKYGDLTTTPTWTRSLYTPYNFNVCPPIVHSKDDIMYSAGGAGTLTSNHIIRNNSGSWDSPLAFSTYMQIPSICEFNNYLAIGGNNPDGTCTIYFWNRDSSLATLSEKIECGSGTIKWINTVEGTLVVCIIQEPTGLSIAPNVVFKYYNGVSMQLFDSFTTSAATVYQFTQRFNNQILFLASMTINGTTLSGTWRITKDSRGLHTSFDRLVRLDDTPSALYGFLQTGDYLHVALNSSGYLVSKTGNTYSTTASLETTINQGMTPGDKPKKKQLMAVAAIYDPLPAGGAVVFSYKVDGGSWIDVFNDTTVGSTNTEMTSANTDAASHGTTYAQFTSGRGYELRVKPSGNVKIVGIIYKYEIVPTNI